MEDLIVAIISGLVELFCSAGNFLWWWGDDSLLPINMDIALSLVCIVMGAGAGALSAIIVKHALLPKASLRIAMLFLSPPSAGLGMSRYLNPQDSIERRLLSRAFWLPFWLILAYLAMRLVHVIK